MFSYIKSQTYAKNEKEKEKEKICGLNPKKEKKKVYLLT